MCTKCSSVVYSETNFVLDPHSMDAMLFVSSENTKSNDKFYIYLIELSHEKGRDAGFADICWLLDGSLGVDARDLGGKALDFVIENDSLFFVDRKSL